MAGIRQSAGGPIGEFSSCPVRNYGDSEREMSGMFPIIGSAGLRSWTYGVVGIFPDLSGVGSVRFR